MERQIWTSTSCFSEPGEHIGFDCSGVVKSTVFFFFPPSRYSFRTPADRLQRRKWNEPRHIRWHQSIVTSRFRSLVRGQRVCRSCYLLRWGRRNPARSQLKRTQICHVYLFFWPFDSVMAGSECTPKIYPCDPPRRLSVAWTTGTSYAAAAAESVPPHIEPGCRRRPPTAIEPNVSSHPKRCLEEPRDIRLHWG